MNIRLLTYIILIALGFSSATGASLRFSGLSDEVIRLDTDKSTGLEGIYVAYSLNGLSAIYTPDNQNAPIKWYSYDYRGGAYAVAIGNGSVYDSFSSGGGYIVEEGDKRLYFWLVDYSASPMTAGNLTVSGADCTSVELSFSGSAPAIGYYSITGRYLEIDRQIALRYYTLTPGEQYFSQKEICSTMASVTPTFSIQPPLCATRFTLSGDRFLTAWGKKIDCTADIFSPIAVEGITSAEQLTRDTPNEQTSTEATLGGSAPSTVTFSASVSDAAVFTEWQIAEDADFENIRLRERALDFEHTFADTGSFYVRFVCANAYGSCEWTSDTYTVSTGESRLRCPNAFSPGASEGINDEWKVSYRSLIRFECHIFNSLGVKMAELRDPSQGWDGKYKGTLVKPGVYYYVIKATGADGKQYNLSGDINIVGTRSR